MQQNKKTFLGGLENPTLGQLKIYEGIDESLINQLINYANNDTLVKKFTSDAKRFKDIYSFNFWLNKGRSVYVLTDDRESLAGVIWYGESEMPTDREFISKINPKIYGVTFAIRVYDRARGKKLARQFMDKVFKAFMDSIKYNKIKNKGFWLETSEDNIPAIVLYERFGFSKVTKPDINNKVLMIKK